MTKYDLIEGPSKIHGIGAFVTRDFKKGDEINCLSIKCHGINHSDNPNVKSGADTTPLPWSIEGKVFAVALRDIKKGEEITVCYSVRPDNEIEITQ